MKKRNNSKLQILARKHAERVLALQARGRRRAKRRERSTPTPFTAMFPPIKDKTLPKDGAAYL